VRFFVVMISHGTNTSAPLRRSAGGARRPRSAAAGPALSSSNLERFAYTRVRRPIVRLDDL
jgi:hypothetical protein